CFRPSGNSPSPHGGLTPRHSTTLRPRVRRGTPFSLGASQAGTGPSHCRAQLRVCRLSGNWFLLGLLTGQVSVWMVSCLGGAVGGGSSPLPWAWELGYSHWRRRRGRKRLTRRRPHPQRN